jgi:DNA-binding protein HU-beta
MWVRMKVLSTPSRRLGMNRRELVDAVASHTDTDKKTVDTVIHGLTEVILATVAGGDPVAISGFAKFSKSERAARQGRNPQTGETIQIAAKTAAKITPLKGFKDVVLGVTPAPKL